MISQRSKFYSFIDVPFTRLPAQVFFFLCPYTAQYVKSVGRVLSVAAANLAIRVLAPVQSRDDTFLNRKEGTRVLFLNTGVV